MGFWARLLPVWRGTWRVPLPSGLREVRVEWDAALSGGGSVQVDGVVVERWSFGLKGLPASRSFTFEGLRFDVFKGAGVWGAQELRLHVSGVEQPRCG